MSQQLASSSLQYDALKKSVGVAYLLWFFFGYLGAHRFYLKQNGTAIAILVITLGSFVLTIILIGLIGFLVVGLWLLVDAFLIPGLVEKHNLHLAERFEKQSI
jgi:TM2 domain-containing membrane protein YozV